MRLNKLWKEAELASDARLAEISYNAWHKDERDLTLEESFYLCDSMLESFDLPPLSLACVSAAKILAGRQWAICGGTAVSKLVKPRTTVDVDILVADRSTALSLLLRSNEFFQAEGNKLKHRSGGEIDLLDTESGFWRTPKQVARHALATANRQRVCGEDLPMVTPAGLIATKLGRAMTDLIGADQDKVDIINVLFKYGYQDLADFGISSAMQDEYDRLIARAKAVQPEQ